MVIPLKRSLVGIALRQVRQHVDAGHWPLGQYLPLEPELVELLDMNRNIVREVVRVLTFSDVLGVHQGDGTYARACTNPLETMLVLACSAVQYSLGVRRMVEIEAARLAAIRRGDSDLNALHEYLNASRQRHGSDDLQDCIGHDTRFCQRMVDAARNPVLSELYRYFSQVIRTSLGRIMANPQRVQPCSELHQRLPSTIERGDPDAAAAANRTLLIRARDRPMTRALNAQPEMHPGHPPKELLIDAEVDDEPAPPAPPLRPWLLLLSPVLVTLNLRPALPSLAPLLNQVRDGTGFSATAAGLLTTAPVLCLGLLVPLAPRLARRIGTECSVLLILFCLAGGIILRSLFPVFGLFADSILAGASISITGVLLPGIVKRDFPRRAGVMTGVYTMILRLEAALAAGVTAPLEKLFGDWELALTFWSPPAIFAVALWLPQTHQDQHTHHQAFRVVGLWRDPPAWQVTLYIGLQSSLAYIVSGWLPSILIDRDMTAVEAGLVLSGSVMLQLITALLTP